MTNTTSTPQPTVNTCPWCGDYKTSRAKYCSRNCGYKARRAQAPQCEAADCDKPVQARGMCGSHYGVWHRANNPDAHSYICHGCGVSYTAARKAQGDKAFCTADCQRRHAASNEVAVARRTVAYMATCAARPIPVKECQWCQQEFETRIAAVKYCSDPCKKDAAKDRRMKSLSPLRYAYEHGDNAGIIEALRDGSTITPNGCWEWKTIRDGYPRAKLGSGHMGAHRLSLEAKHGAPLGEQAAHHMCANAKCVNPDHLQPVTHRENIAEMLARNSYLKRIAELEEVIKEISPNHEVLNRIRMN